MMRCARAVILLNGNKSDVAGIRRYIDDDTLLIGCDGGTNHLHELGLKPHIVIGDFDSYAPQKQDDGVEYIHYPSDKDLTDSELAIRYAIKRGCKEVIVAGLLGNRVDHLLANTLLLTKRAFASVDLKIIEGNQEIYLLRGDATIHGKKGDTISFIPIKGTAKVSQTSGLKYDLSKYKLSLQGNQGISNVLTKNTAEVSVVKGSLLVIHSHQASGS